MGREPRNNWENKASEKLQTWPKGERGLQPHSGGRCRGCPVPSLLLVEQDKDPSSPP